MLVQVGYGVITSGNSVSEEHFTEIWVIFLTYLQSSPFVLQQFCIPFTCQTNYALNKQQVQQIPYQKELIYSGRPALTAS